MSNIKACREAQNKIAHLRAERHPYKQITHVLAA
jgi:hypothetical protein